MNPGTIIVGLIVVGIIFLAARSLYRNKKNGGTCAGCSGCADADHSGACHKE